MPKAKRILSQVMMRTLFYGYRRGAGAFKQEASWAMSIRSNMHAPISADLAMLRSSLIILISCAVGSGSSAFSSFMDRSPLVFDCVWQLALGAALFHRTDAGTHGSNLSGRASSGFSPRRNHASVVISSNKIAIEITSRRVSMAHARKTARGLQAKSSVRPKSDSPS